MSIELDQDRGRRRDELINNTYKKGKHHLKSMLKDVFGFAEHQDKATYGLGYKLTITRNKDEAALHKTVALADARNKNDHIHLCVSQHRPSIENQGILSKQILSKTPTELRYIERSVCMKDVTNQNL